MGVLLCVRGDGHGGDVWLPERPAYWERRGWGENSGKPRGLRILCRPQDVTQTGIFVVVRTLQLQYANTTLQRKKIKALF